MVNGDTYGQLRYVGNQQGKRNTGMISHVRGPPKADVSCVMCRNDSEGEGAK